MLNFFSPAKVNLFFKILKKRDDGFHEIASLYQAISLKDEISFKLSKEDSFFCLNISLKWDDNNLIKKAVNFFREKTQIFHPLQIRLKKNIPIEAGLGGGSSNAATTLWALNEIFSFPLKIYELIELSKKIGSDVAFFFSKGSAYCYNKGDEFKNVNFSYSLKFFIAKPSFGMSTKDVYENVDLKLLKKQDPKDILNGFLEKKYQFVNDLEISAFQLNKNLKNIKKELLKEFDLVSMSGSGSSFICFSDKKIKNFDKISLYPVFSIQRKEKSWYSF